MKLNEVYRTYNTVMNESIGERISDTDDSALTDRADSLATELTPLEIRNNIMEFFQEHRDWFISDLKPSKILKLLETEEGRAKIDFDKLYLSDIRGEMVEEFGLPKVYKFFKYFDDSIFVLVLSSHFTDWNWKGVMDKGEIKIEIKTDNPTKKGILVFRNIHPTLGQVYFDNPNGYTLHFDTEYRQTKIDNQAYFKYLEIVEKMCTDIQGLVKLFPKNKSFVREKFWLENGNANSNLLIEQNTFSYPLMRWIKH